MSNAIRGMVGELDPHSSFMDAEEFEDLRIATEGNYSGIGVEVTIDGRRADRDRAARRLARGARRHPRGRHDPLDRRPAAAAPARSTTRSPSIRGEPGTVVKLGIGREPLTHPLEFAIVRAMVSVHSVRYEMLEPGIGYLRISQFSDTTGADTEAAVLALEEQAGGRLRGLVLDLRNNPGGVLDAAVEVSDFFLERGTIVSAEGRSAESRFRMEAMDGRPRARHADRRARERGLGLRGGDRRRRAARQRPRAPVRPEDLRQGLGADGAAARGRAGAEAHHLALLHALRRLDPRARHRAGRGAAAAGARAAPAIRRRRARPTRRSARPSPGSRPAARRSPWRNEARAGSARGGLRGTRGRHHHRHPASRRASRSSSPRSPAAR